MMISLFIIVENMMGKGENAGNQHFLLFPPCFQQASFSRSLKVRTCVVKSKSTTKPNTMPSNNRNRMFESSRCRPIIENRYFRYNIIQQNLLRLKMSIIVLLLPSYFFFFVLPRIIIYKSKITKFSLQSNILITSLFWKLTKVSTNNLKPDIKGTSGRLTICKNIIIV